MPLINNSANWIVAHSSIAYNLIVRLLFLLCPILTFGQNEGDSLNTKRKFLIGIDYFNSPATGLLELYNSFGIDLIYISKRQTFAIWPMVGPKVGVTYQGSDYSYWSYGNPNFSNYQLFGFGITYQYKMNRTPKVDILFSPSSTISFYKGVPWGIQEKKQVLQFLPGFGTRINIVNGFYFSTILAIGIAYHHDTRESPPVNYKKTFNNVFASGLIKFSALYSLKK